MDRKNSRKGTVAKLKTQRGEKKPEGSTSKFKPVNGPKKVKLKNPPPPQDSSSSDDIDEDYAVFLKTYNPQEFYPSGYTSKEDGGSQVTVEPKGKAMKPLGVEPSK
ncbi:hypothetical protein QL285_076521 [Trifolium repens]|nr:hypothetical protein QL285_076521 [Trifolium repens]